MGFCITLLAISSLADNFCVLLIRGNQSAVLGSEITARFLSLRYCKDAETREQQRFCRTRFPVALTLHSGTVDAHNGSEATFAQIQFARPVRPCFHTYGLSKIAQAERLTGDRVN